ncbi:MAG: hypothetical protein H7X91_08315 [Burkholderiales bacterium]|nr:hypothetical protein [Burkholderiales bacterium]
MKLATSILIAVGAAFSTGAFAADAGSAMQRDINQQQRIEQGLQSGVLNTREAATLERQQSHLNRLEANALKDGALSDAEKRRIRGGQNKASKSIYRQKHDAQTGNPNSASSQRMQADVQRNINQEKRIGQGLQSGELTNQEAARLERGQARITEAQARAGADGHLGAHEQRNIQKAENRQSRRIFEQKHDAQKRP